MAETVVFEITDARRLPKLLAELRRLDCTDAQWCIDDSGTGWLRVIDPPTHMLFHAEFDPNIRAHRAWKNRRKLEFQELTRRFRVGAANSVVKKATSIRVHVVPRLVADREPGPAELWVLADEAILLNWLAHADDRLVDRLDVARFQVNGVTKIALQSRKGRGGTPVLALDAESYRPYLKLSNFFIPVSKKMSPPLRRDLAMRAYSSDANQIVFLDEHGHRASIPTAAFVPLSQSIRYHAPMPTSRPSMSIVPVFELESYEAKDLPAGSRIDLAAGPNQPERLAMVWDKNQWRILPTRSKS